MTRYIPNILTVFRILILPALVAFLLSGGSKSNIISATIFFLSGFTDFLDGIIARRLKLETHFGRVMDPISDKMLIITALVTLLYLDKAHIVPALFIINRELIVSGVREYLAAFGIDVPVTNLARVKTALQGVAILALMLGDQVIGYWATFFIGTCGLWVVTAITLVTGYQYCRSAVRSFMSVSQASPQRRIKDKPEEIL